MLEDRDNAQPLAAAAHRKTLAMTSDFDPPSKGLRVAEHVKSGDGQIDAIQRATGIYESRGVGNSYLITTVEGDVLVNAGSLGDARRGRELFKQVSSSPIRYIILTQSHANQYGGLEVYKTRDNTVIAHRSYPEDRKYSEALNAHYRRGSRKFFGEITGSMKDIVPTREVPPDVLIDARYAFDLGGRQFEVIWTPGGETRSSVIVWLASERIALVGNLFGPLFGNHPNLNTLRGDKPRSALEFIESAKVVRALKPELLLTGHEAIHGGEHIEQQITRIIDAVQWVHDRTVDGMNEGIDVRTLMRTIKTPPEITLTEEYGKIAWNVRAVWHEYTGWFDPSRGTTELYGSPSSCIAPLIVKLVGNVEMLAEHAFALVEQGRPLEAIHLIDIALSAEPNNAVVREAKRDALNALLAQTSGRNLWERMWIASELRELSQ
jgi:alkyl sulfatase BDS1-like metallo-beta-lactamase superfamily hydrolase